MKLFIQTNGDSLNLTINDKDWVGIKGQLMNCQNDFVCFGAVLLRKSLILAVYILEENNHAG